MEKKPATDLEKRKKQQQAHQALIEYFGHFKDYDNLRSRGTELFIKYASLFGSSCTECEQLKKMFLRELDWSERYDQVEKKLGELEEAYDKEIKGLTKFSHQGQFHPPMRPPHMGPCFNLATVEQAAILSPILSNHGRIQQSM